MKYNNLDHLKSRPEFIPKYQYEEFKQLLIRTPTYVRGLFHPKNEHKLLELLYHSKSIEHATYAQRAYHIINSIPEIPPCPVCTDSRLRWNTETGKYSVTCGNRDCISKSSQQAYKKTMLDLYGVTNIFAANEFKEDLKKKNLERHGVEQYVQSHEFKEKYIQHMQETFGADHYLQNPNKLAEVQERLKIKNGKIVQRNHLTLDTIEKLEDKNWLIEQHHAQQRTLKDIAKELGVDKKTIATKLKEFDVEIRRYNFSTPEKELQDLLESHGLVVEMRNRAVLGSNLELDIYIPAHNLAIEYSGLYWHSDGAKKNAKCAHKKKYDLCRTRGIRLITIFEDEWIEQRGLIEDKLLNILKLPTCNNSIYARKCNITKISKEDKKLFFESNHIQGDGPSSINYGLEYNGNLVAAIGFIKQKDHFVLNRYATSCNVPGGFSRLLKHFEREYDAPKIVTFADLRWSEGDLYKNTGFTLDKELSPDYYWVKYERRWHKFNFRHSGMKNKLKNYNPKLSESTNMYNHGYYKLWDCGKLKFVKN